MVIWKSATLFYILSIASAWAQIDLTPSEMTQEIDGSVLRTVAFSDGERKITISPDPMWKITPGSRSRAAFQHVEKPGDVTAYVEVRETGFPKSMETLISGFLASLPGGVAPIGEIEAVEGWVMMGAPTWILSADYLSQGQTQSKRSFYLTYEEQQWIFSLVCEPALMDEMWKSFSNVIGSFAFESVSHLTPVVIAADTEAEDNAVE